MAKRWLWYIWSTFGFPLLLSYLSKFLSFRFDGAITHSTVQIAMWVVTCLNCVMLEARVNPTERQPWASTSLVKIVALLSSFLVMRDNAEADHDLQWTWELRTFILVNFFLCGRVLPSALLWFDTASHDEQTTEDLTEHLFWLLLFLDSSRIYLVLGLWTGFYFKPQVEVLLRVRFAGFWLSMPMPWLIRSLERVEAYFVSQRTLNAADYKYRPLAARDIRLLKIKKWEPLKRIHCEMMTVSVDSPPPYEAISHAWETTARCEDIIINGNCRLPVPARVHRLLRYRRNFVSSKLIWIDGLCIDQTNLDERAHQVQMMGDIFSNASRVVVWLATPEEAPNSGQLAQAVQSLSRNSKWGAPPQMSAALLGNDHWSVLRRFFHNRWFSRVWMVQEVALPPKVHVIYGTACMDWVMVERTARVAQTTSFGGQMEDMLSNNENGEYLRRSRNIGNVRVMSSFRARVLHDRKRILGQTIFDSFDEFLRLDRETLTLMITTAFQGYVDLEILLFATREFDSTDERDKVFAVLGMVLDPEMSTQLPIPDYRTEFYKCYHQAAALLLRARKSPIHILVIAGLGLRRFQDLAAADVPPSWVPDFRCPRGRLSAVNIPEHLGIPEGEDGLHLTVAPDPGKLGLSVCFVDEILEVGPLNEHPNLYTDNAQGITWQQTAEYAYSWLQKTKTMALGQNDQDQSNMHIIDDFWRALFLNRVLGPSGERPLSDDEVRFLKDRFEQTLELFTRLQVDQTLRLLSAGGGSLVRLLPLVHSLQLTSFGRALCRTTQKGRFVMAPPLTEKGDMICFFKGSNGPWLLRPASRLLTATDTTPRYYFVGSCFVHKLDYPRAETGDGFRLVDII